MARIDDKERDILKSAELDSAELKTKRWTGKQINEKTVEFTRELPTYKLRLTKRYELMPINTEKNQTATKSALRFKSKTRAIKNVGRV